MKGLQRILDAERTLKKLMDNRDYFTSYNMANMVLECRRELLEGSREILFSMEESNQILKNLLNKLE